MTERIVIWERPALLKNIRVSGFKSLQDFSLEFHKGLNVLIGPNGSGKTNILNFIEFLGHLSRSPLLEAVSRGGGAGKIFRRDNSGALGKSVSFTISGDGVFQEYRGERPQHVFYEYSAEIALSGTSGELAYARQRLRLAFGKVRLDKDWAVDIRVSALANEEVDVAFAPGTPEHFHDQYLPPPRRTNTPEVRAATEELISRNAQNTALYQLLSRYLTGAELLIHDLYGAKSFNISPSAVRRPEDIASDPQIEEDGAGLAAVLFALTRSRKGYYTEHFLGPRRFRAPEDALTKVISFSKIVNDAIHDIIVRPDAIENQLRIFLKVDYGDGSLELPFSLVSDGTAKWFTLVTAIVTSVAVFSIEEPENFLHPLMQREIVRIVRDAFSSGTRDGFAVMTTHSETILNCVDPDEMVLIHMESGRTVARRPSNSEDIRKEINKTGFGAGYFYLAGAIE